MPQKILFDQHSRYRSLADAIEAMLPHGGTVLDVGCGPERLLGRFLPGYEITFLDPLLADLDESNVLGRPFTDGCVPDASYDVVVCVDVLEHVPAEARPPFLRRMLQASRHGIVVSAPFADATEAAATDEHVDFAYRCKHGHSYPWLEEHEAYGLPELSEVRTLLESQGLFVATAGNGHTRWLGDLLGMHVVMLDDAEHRELLERIGDRFTTDLMEFDHLPPSYRIVVAADRRGTPVLRRGSDDEATRARAAAAWSRFRGWVDAELAAHADALARRRRKAEEAAARAEKRLDEADEHLDRALDRAREESEAQIAKIGEELEEERNRLHEQKLLLEEQQKKINTLTAAFHHEHETTILIRRSLSWRLTAPLRLAGRSVAGMRRAALHGAAWLLQRAIPERMRWPLKSTFFAVFRPFLRGTKELREFDDARRWRNARREEVEVEIAPSHPELADVVVFGVIDWHLRIQRPQHLARQLAHLGHRVFYLAPGYLQAGEPGYDIVRLEDDLSLYEVRLHTPEAVSIYRGAPEESLRKPLAEGLRRLLADAAFDTGIALVDHPGWVDLAAMLPRSVVVYDCMDNHHGFAETGDRLASDERRLVELADAVIVTSDHLLAEMGPRHRHVSMVRNGCDPSWFARAVRGDSPGERPVVGYFGAIAQWFDAALLRRVAEGMPECDFVLVGDDTADVRKRLGDVDNIRFTGEVPYADLIPHVRAMDVLFIPFVIDELTLATNPVKAYEALAAGKPVVATPMPELMQTDLAPFVRIGGDAEECIESLREALAERADDDIRRARMAYARKQSWSCRARDLVAAIADAPKPRVAVVIVSWNGVELTRRCVRSVLDDRIAPDLDVIIVDNASTDGTSAWLDEIEREPRVRVIRNETNLGFGAACNQGLEVGFARDPDVLVILNNDIVVTPGWARTICHHLERDESIGLIGPVTNNIGNEARVETTYGDLDAMQREQRTLTGARAGSTFEIPVLAFFCVAIPREVYAEVGGLDTNFGTGFFEDDDYCQRVRAIGRRIVCAEDVFVHHELSASFDRIDQKERQRLFERNRAYYESKWGPWRPHTYRQERRGGGAAAG